MKDWFFQTMTIGQAYKLYEQLRLTTQFKNGVVLVEREKNDSNL